MPGPGLGGVRVCCYALQIKVRRQAESRQGAGSADPSFPIVSFPDSFQDGDLTIAQAFLDFVFVAQAGLKSIMIRTGEQRHTESQTTGHPQSHPPPISLR